MIRWWMMLPCAILLHAMPSHAAPAKLKEQQDLGLRTECVYELNGRTTTVTIGAGETCPAETDIDPFAAGSSRKETTKVPPGESRILSGELDQGSHKSCAYRGRDGTVYRNVGRGMPCPGSI